MTDLTDAPAASNRRWSPRAGGYRTTRLVAAVAGLIGFLMAILTPILPIDQKTAELAWPQNDEVTNVTAPMVSFVPIDMSTSVPCSLARELPAGGGDLMSTLPANGQQATARGMFVRASADTVSMVVRDVVLLSVDRRVAQSSPDCAFTFTGGADGVSADITGLPAEQTTGTKATGTQTMRYRNASPDMRPQIVGVFSDLPSDAPRDGLSLHATVDTRFINSPTPLKLAVIVIGIVMTLLSLVALGILDARDGRGHRRFLPRGWFTIRGPDVAVFLALAAWWLIGGNTSDDGYNITVARITGEAGYADNYFRYFGVPQDPFGWHFQVLSWMTHISVATPWLRLPAFLLGLLGWWLISREAIPRLGRAVRNSTAAVWAGAMVFLAIWMPYNNGIRPEPAEAVGALLTWVCVERAIATKRLLPFAVATVTAGFTLALAPGGLMAAAALIAGLRPLVKGIVSRRRRDGLLALIAPVLAAGTAVLFMIFYSQALGPLLEGNKVATEVGPTEEWWREPTRYYWLVLDTGDGTFPRRFGILMMILALVVAIFRLMSSRRPAGVARGPFWRLIGVMIGTMFFTSFTPTKWTHHFGIYAAIGAILVAGTTAMMAPKLLRSRRNRTFFAAAVLLVTAVATAGTNMWWYVGSYGIPWWDRPIEIAGVKLSWVMLAATLVVAAVGLWFHFRDDFTDDDVRTGTRKSGLLKFTFSPIPVIAGIVVLIMLGSFVKAAWVQRDSWSWAKSNARALTGDECALANDVLVEADPNKAVLRPADVDRRPAPAAKAALGANNTGFTAEGVPSNVLIDPLDQRRSGDEESDVITPPAAGGDSVDSEIDDATSNDPADQASAEQVQSAEAVKLPYGLDPATVPVLGSYGSQQASELTTGWYDMGVQADQAGDDRPLLTVAAAGSIASLDEFGVLTPGRRVVAEYGRIGDDGRVVPVGAPQVPHDAFATSSNWRTLRFELTTAPPRATVVRLHVVDDAMATQEWVAITPPRLPALATLNDVVGRTDPVFIDWMPGLVFPCQRPMAVSYGLLELPQWRIMPDAEATRKNTQTWSDGVNGGPLGITDALLSYTLVPTYLRNNWGRDWGGLERYFPLVPDARPADIIKGSHTVSGLENPAPMRAKGY
ncbi:arabinosyltransferase domain-containing protein [Gordonia sp. HY442]|uniref:arabinosyltransferase domain-containing protein n=1 Tax=Gordonia zhenghanii TaxID=2911516 RepID=UPI001F02840C|nr:arabinosyltransferase domain-containing protein [Gordonia zhenghanii]MCF8607548.1 arabinosyltransferase domain-containing protein [Gordonia zhenghanii]